MTEKQPNGIAETLKFGIEGKKLLLKKGLTSGKRRCPRCKAWVRFALAGRKSHLRMSCDTPSCSMRMME